MSASVTLATKVCRKCLRVLPLDGFGRDKSKTDGMSYTCRKCHAAVSAAFYARHPERHKAAVAKWQAENAESFRASKAKWRALNVEKVRVNHARYRAENAEQIREANARYRAEHVEEGRASAIAWRHANPEAAMASIRAYQARKAGAFIGPIPKDIKAQLIELYGPTCMVPDCENIGDLELDHIVPLSKGGAHAVDNFQLLCSWCNKSKGNRSSADYRPVPFVLRERTPA